MIEHGNLKYAMRAGTDVVLSCVVRYTGMAERRGTLRLLRIYVTDGRVTLPLVVFGGLAGRRYRAGVRLRARPVYWSERRGSFAVKRGGSVAIV